MSYPPREVSMYTIVYIDIVLFKKKQTKTYVYVDWINHITYILCKFLYILYLCMAAGQNPSKP